MSARGLCAYTLFGLTLAVMVGALPGCDGLSINIVLPPVSGDPGDPADGSDPLDPIDTDDVIPDSVFVCVVNETGLPITYRVSVLGLAPVLDAAGVGETVCFDGPCGADVGIDMIEAGLFLNEVGAQFLAESIPCGEILELRVQPDGSVVAFVIAS